MLHAPIVDPLHEPFFHASIIWLSPSCAPRRPSFSHGLLPVITLLTLWSWWPWRHASYFGDRKGPWFVPSPLWRNRHLIWPSLRGLVCLSWFLLSALLFKPYGVRSSGLLRLVSFATAYSSLAKLPYFFFSDAQFQLPFSLFNRFFWMPSPLLI